MFKDNFLKYLWNVEQDPFNISNTSFALFPKVEIHVSEPMFSMKKNKVILGLYSGQTT